MTDLLESEPETPDYALHHPLVSPKKSHYLNERPSPRSKKHTENGHRTNGHHHAHTNGDSVIEPKGWKPFLIGVAGGTASGKTSVCRKIMCKLGQNELEDQDRRVVTISSDNFYRVLNEEERTRARAAEFNFDHPDALDFELILETMNTLLEGKVARVPVYDFVTHSRHPNEYINVYPADVILFEGILVFYFPDLRSLFQLKLFVDMDADTRVIRRMARDIKERGRDLQSVMHQYTYFVKPAFEEFCQPTKKYADVIIPRGAENEVAINLIVQHIKEHLLPQAESKNGSKNGSPRRSIQEEPEKIPITNGFKH